MRFDGTMYTSVHKKVAEIKIARLIFLMILIASVYIPINFGINVQGKEDEDFISIKWGLIVLGGYDYYAKHSFNPIQRVERYIQARGVPYDLFQDDDIEAPTNNLTAGKYSLQYANGSTRYQVLVLIINSHRDSSAINVNYIYSAIGNGTNAVIFGMAAKFVPQLLGILPSEVTYFEDYRTPYGVNISVKETFDDGIKRYERGSVVNITAPYYAHTKVQNSNDNTVWYIMSRPGNWWIGMMNGTFGKGQVWYNSLVTDSNNFLYPMNTYENSWVSYHFDFVGHAINFMFNQVEKVNLGLQGYKKWKGALIIRLDQDTRYGIHTPINEEALKAGWVYDYVICPLGYREPYSSLVSDGMPKNYTGSPSSKVKNGNATYFRFNGEDHTFKFIIYNSTVNGNYDRIRLDFNENKDFSDETEYGIFDNITYTGLEGKYYWAYLDNQTNPTKVNFGRWQPLRYMIPTAWLETYKYYGATYGVTFGFQDWQHTDVGNASFYHVSYMWDGSKFIGNQTWVEEMYNKSREELIYNFGSNGNGFDANEITLSHPGNRYAQETRHASGNLTYFLFEYGSRSPWGDSEREPGFYLPKYGKPILSAAFGGDTYAKGWAFDGLIDMVKTLYSVVAVYGHNTGSYNLSYTFTPYSDMLKPANPRDAYHFWYNARYMLRNMVNAYYKNGKITLEFKANSTLKDYVWKFPIQHNDRYFTSFSDNRSVGKIKYFDGKYVYVEFSQGQGKQKLEATYGPYPYLYKTSSPIGSITQVYTAKNLTLQLWNDSGSISVDVNTTRFGQPTLVTINGNPISFIYNPTTKIASFNVTFGSLITIEVIWEYAPPDPPLIALPSADTRFDPGKSVTFSWTFSDPDLGDSQSAFRFQLDDNRDFSSPIIDTGKVTSSSMWTTQTLPNEVSVYYWRVNTWDTQDSEGWWSESQTIIVDRLKIILKGVTDKRTDVGTLVAVYFKIVREYDNVTFDGSMGKVYINGSEATWDATTRYWKLSVKQNSVGESEYQISNIIDVKNQVTAINDHVGAQQVIWDKLVITITPDATRVPVGTRVHFTLKAVYAYDNQPVSSWNVNILRDGVHFTANNFSDISNYAYTHQYTVENVIEATYGLTTFTSNSPSVTWTEVPKTFVQLLFEWITANALVVLVIVNLIVDVFLAWNLLVHRPLKNERKSDASKKP